MFLSFVLALLSDQIYTGKRIWDRLLISSIKPKFDNQFFVDLHVLYKFQTWNCSDNSEKQINFTFSISTKHVYRQSISLEILAYLSFILLAVHLVPVTFWSHVKIVLCKFCISGMVLITKLTQKYPINAYIKVKFAYMETSLVETTLCRD